MKMSAASVACTDMELRPTRHAGRGGVGAVMGSKGVKVIVLDDTGMKMRAPKDPEKFREANKKFGRGPPAASCHRTGPSAIRHQCANQHPQ